MKNYTSKITAILLSAMMVGAVGCGQSTTAGAPVELPDATADTTVAVQPQEEEVTVESLIKGLQDKVNASEGIGYQNDLEMVLEMSLLGETVSSEAKGTGSTESDGVNSFTKTTITSESDGTTTTTDSEIYFIKEGDKFTKYELTNGTWYKSTEDSGAGVDFNKMTDFDFSTATLDTTDTEYVVVASLAYDDVNDTVPTPAEDIGVEPDSSRIDNVKVPVEFHFNKETKELESMFIDMGPALNDAMQQVTTEAIAEKAAENGVEAPTDTASLFSMNITKFTITMHDFDFNARVIELPEAAQNAVEKPTVDYSQAEMPNVTISEVPTETVPAATN